MTTSRFTSFRTAGLITVLAGWAVCTATTARAAFTDDFDALVVELQSRSLAWSNSVIKTEQKQKKVCDKVLLAIGKPADSLSDDLKTAVKVTKSLVKAFPNEFSATAPAPHAVLLNNLSGLLSNVFTNIQSDILDELTELTTTVNALPPSSAKTTALAAIAQAQTALTQADNAPDFASYVKALASALNAIAAGQKAADSAGGGGGGSCGTIAVNSVTMTVQSAAWSAIFAGADYFQSVKGFHVGGTANDGTALGLGIDSGVTGPGTYTTGISGAYTIGSPPTQIFNVTSGSIKIDGLDLATTTTCGSASFTATDGMTIITVTDVQFGINNLDVQP